MLDVLIIGAGHMGLTIGRIFKEKKYNFVILESASRVGESWRTRWDSLLLFSTRALSSIPGFPMPGEQNGYPTKDEMASYLEVYAKHFDLPVRTNTLVSSLAKQGNLFLASTPAGQILARTAVVATGFSARGAVPEIFRRGHSPIFEIHSSQYKNPRQILPGSVLVVGGGNSAAQIAVELLEAGREVAISTRRKLSHIPQEIFGKNFLWWVKVFMPITLFFGDNRRPRYNPVVGKKLPELITRGRLELLPEIQAINGDTVIFSSNLARKPQNIIWATGFRFGLEWIRIPKVFDLDGYPISKYGKSIVPGLFFLGLSRNPNRAGIIFARFYPSMVFRWITKYLKSF